MSTSSLAPAPLDQLAPPPLTITVPGTLNALTAPDLRRRILEAGDLGFTVAVDLSDVDVMDAAGLAAVIGPRRRLRARGLDVVLVGALSPSVRRTLAVTRFAPMFNVGDDGWTWE